MITTFVLGDAQDRDTVDAEYKSFQRGTGVGHVAGGVNDAWLESGCVCDLEQRVDVLQIDLPKFEYLYLCRVRHRQFDWKVFSFLVMGPGLKPVRPYFLKYSIVTVRRMWLAVFNNMAGSFVLILGLYRLFDQMAVLV